MRKWDNYVSSLAILQEAPQQDLNNEFVQGGIINKFSLQFELGWKLFKALLAYEGDPVSATGSPRDVIKTAYRYYGFMDEDIWLDMLRDRNTVSHVYDEQSAIRLIRAINDCYIPEFEAVRDGLAERYGDMLTADDA